MRLAKSLSVISLSALVSLAACGGDDGASTCEIGADTPTHQYVVSAVQVPASPNEASQIALDLDGAEPQRNDNQLGMVIATLASQADFDVKGAVDEAVANGDIILLVELAAEDLARSDCAQASVFLGANPTPAACTDEMDQVCGNHLDGNGSFEISPSSPSDAVVTGSILNGGFTVSREQAGQLSIELSLIDGQAPITLNLIGARVQASSISETGLMSGLIAGAITKEDLDTDLMPTIHQLVSDAVAADCTGTVPPDCCTANSTGETILNVFNTEESMDCVISLEEITENPLISSLLAPDVDLLDENEAYNPGAEGTPDSLSIGLGFTAVGASF